MSKQLTLFGTRSPSANSYVVYRDPKGDYESFIERYCLRSRRDRGHIANKKLVAEAQGKWTSIYKGDSAKLKEFLALQENEKPFVRYLCTKIHIAIQNNNIYVLPKLTISSI
jgi:hypothetical protein